MFSLKLPIILSLACFADGFTVTSTSDLWKTLQTLRVEGDALKTCSLDHAVQRAEILMKSGGRPLHGELELWQGYSNTPQKIKVYVEDGKERSIRATLECPGTSNSVSIRNTAGEEFPIVVGLKTDYGGNGISRTPMDTLRATKRPQIVQGGAVHTVTFPPGVDSVQILLQSDGRPMDARIEFLQGPNNIKQSMEVFSEDGGARTLYTIMDAPGSGNVVRIINTNTVEYPIQAFIEPFIIDEGVIESTRGMTWSKSM
jgi:hypothetical protein